MFKQFVVYYLLVIVGASLDLMVLALCHTQMLFSVRALYYAQAATQVSLARLFLPGAVIILESFLYSGYCGSDLIVMAPLTYALYKVQKIITPSVLVSSLLAFVCFIIHALVIDYGLFDRSLGCAVSLKGSLFHAILIVLIVRYILRGNQGNRS